MSELITKSYRNLLQTIADQPRYFQGKDLVAFYPMGGGSNGVDTMYIGRALNGWHRPFKVEELTKDVEKQLELVLKDCHPSSEPGDPLSWVQNHWSTGKEYNSARSQFWQVIKQLSQERCGEERWWDDIVWTNFFKVTPYRDPPGARMVQVMGKASLNLLLTEITHFKPRNIVCLSGISYAADLLASARTTRKINCDSSLLEYVGDVDLATDEMTRLIIAPHPQSRSASKIADDIKPLLID